MSRTGSASATIGGTARVGPSTGDRDGKGLELPDSEDRSHDEGHSGGYRQDGPEPGHGGPSPRPPHAVREPAAAGALLRACGGQRGQGVQRWVGAGRGPRPASPAHGAAPAGEAGPDRGEQRLAPDGN
jgi:hypothetical protein